MKSADKSIQDGDEEDPGLGVAQIVITAATPMEEVEHPFPGVEEAKNEDKSEKKEVEEVAVEPEEVVETEDQQESITKDEQTEVRTEKKIYY